MKTISLIALLLITLAVPGCSWFKWRSGAGAKSAAGPETIVTPDLSLAAKVVSVNNVGRFVVLGFPAEKMPKLEQTLFIYREGLKIAEVKVTGPQQEKNIVADLISGDPKVGDTVRDQ